ncbi:ras guanine nucleotide exchange factor L-like [Ptychodera flava]|uniref:ras guanine nucleotide exchange factor L-like n=1 Tax=Ptychodera flava TaxID=63121 RepID=UPI00396A64E8
MSKIERELTALNIKPYRGKAYDLRVDLNYRNIASVPLQVFTLTELQWLNLNVNRLKSLPRDISKLTRLRWLFLENNHFEDFPEIITELKELVRLYMGSNRLRALPSSVGELSKLRYLDISDNKFTAFPACLWSDELRGLEKLFLSNNGITNLPKAVEKLTNLKVLWLNNNKIDWIPYSMGEMKNLEELQLAENRLRILPASLCSNLENLNKGNFENNLLIKEYQDVLKKDIQGLRDLEKSVNSTWMRNGRMEMREWSSGARVPCYTMDSHPCGAALIIYNYEYERDLSERSNSDTFRSEISTIRSILSSMGFSVRVMKNLTSLDLIGSLRNLNLEEHSFHDCLLVCILSQGTFGRFMGVDKIGVSFRNLTEIFTEVNSPNLTGKPKIFLMETNPVEDYGPREQPTSVTPTDDDLLTLMTSVEVIPNEADFLLGYANLQLEKNHDGRRGRRSGYLLTVIRALEKLCGKHHMLDILTIANRKTMDNIAKQDGISLTPVLQSTLRYDLYFDDADELYE